MDAAGTVLLRTLETEHAILAGLARLAGDLQHALVLSDFARVDAVAAEMDQAGHRLRDAEAERERLVAAIAGPGASLSDLESAGIPGIGSCRARLAAAVQDLHDVQERNAGLILGASRLTERWLNAIVRLVDPTYGAEGKPHHGGEPRFVSKSA